MAFTTPLRGLAGLSGAPEVSSGIPSPPRSPPLAARNASVVKSLASQQASGRARRGGAAYTITGECERLFCGTLRDALLVKGDATRQDSLVMGMYKNNVSTNDFNDYGVEIQGPGDLPSPESDGMAEGLGVKGLVTDWYEMWDYVGGHRFRGFVAEKHAERTMFVFFDRSIIGGELKAGIMALLELCDHPDFACSKLTVCLDRSADNRAVNTLTKDLGWIGFQLTTLEEFTDGDAITSPKWLFMDMEV